MEDTSFVSYLQTAYGGSEDQGKKEAMLNFVIRSEKLCIKQSVASIRQHILRSIEQSGVHPYQDSKEQQPGFRSYGEDPPPTAADSRQGLLNSRDLEDEGYTTSLGSRRNSVNDTTTTNNSNNNRPNGTASTQTRNNNNVGAAAGYGYSYSSTSSSSSNSTSPNPRLSLSSRYDKTGALIRDTDPQDAGGNYRTAPYTTYLSNDNNSNSSSTTRSRTNSRTNEGTTVPPHLANKGLPKEWNEMFQVWRMNE